VQRPKGLERFEHHQVKRALNDVSLGIRQSETSCWIST
jgi:hypothetical protein